MNLILQRLKQPSTWRGIVDILAAFSVITAKQQSELGPVVDLLFDIIAACFASRGAIGVASNEPKDK